jgi:hypothetical protein
MRASAASGSVFGLTVRNRERIYARDSCEVLAQIVLSAGMIVIILTELEFGCSDVEGFVSFMFTEAIFEVEGSVGSGAAEVVGYVPWGV